METCIEVLHEDIKPYVEINSKRNVGTNRPVRMQSSAYYYSEKSDTHLMVKGWFFRNIPAGERADNRKMFICFFDSDNMYDIPVGFSGLLGQQIVAALVMRNKKEVDLTACDYHLGMVKEETSDGVLWHLKASHKSTNHEIVFTVTDADLERITKVIYDILNEITYDIFDSLT